MNLRQCIDVDSVPERVESLYIAYQIFLNPHASQLQRRNIDTYARRARPAIYVLVYQFTDTTTNTSIARAHVKEISRWYSSQKTRLDSFLLLPFYVTLPCIPPWYYHAVDEKMSQYSIIHWQQ